MHVKVPLNVIIVVLFKPLTSKLRYHRTKPRPKDQRTHAKNLQTPQVNNIKPSYYIDTHSCIFWCYFCAGDRVNFVSWHYECISVILGAAQTCWYDEIQPSGFIHQHLDESVFIFGSLF